jgi:protein-tyrosine-phosphatase
MAAAREAVSAVKALGIEEPSLARHLSRELTRQMISEADVIYAMTASHARAVRAMAPAAAVELLDPGGGDIPDPVGLTREVYMETAERLRGAIEARLGEPEA